MRKTFQMVAFLALGLVALASRADTAYLYWQVNQSGEDAIKFDYARVSVWNADKTELAGDPVYLARQSNPSAAAYSPATAASGYTATDVSVASLLVGSTDYNSSAYSFVVELVAYERYNSGSYDLVGRSAPISYSDVQKSIAYNNTGLPSIEGAMVATEFTRIVPEPTSGLLFLVGGALLALRRKRRA